METNDTSPPAWTITAGAPLQCPACGCTGVHGPDVEDTGGETRLAFRCDWGHAWTLSLDRQAGQTVASLRDLRTRNGEEPAIPWSRSQTGMMYRISDWDGPGLPSITSPEPADDATDPQRAADDTAWSTHERKDRPR